MQSIRKISIAKVIGEVEKPKDSKAVPLMVVAGTAIGTKKGTSDYGDYIGLKGEFAAVNVGTGERFVATVCYLPEPALLPVIVELEKEGVRSVAFSYLISVVRNKTPVGYEYTAEPTTEPKESDPLQALLEQAMKRAEKQNLLPAPKGKAAA